MPLKYKILIVFVGSLTATVLSLISLIVERSIIDFSARSGFGFNFAAAAAYIVVPIYFAILAFVLSLFVLQFNSLSATLAVSVLVSLLASWKAFGSAAQIYRRADYFDKTYFYSDVFQICTAFVIFPLIGVLVHYLKTRYAGAAQIQ